MTTPSRAPAARAPRTPEIGHPDAFRSLYDFLFSVVSRSRDIIVVADDAGTITFATGAIEEITGWTASDLVGTDGLHLIHPEDLPSFGEHLNRLVEQPDEPSITQVRISRAAGGWVWTEVVALNLLADPSVRGLVGHFRDITDRKHAELALRESEERFRWLVQSGFDLLAIIDRDGKMTYLSPSHERILGHPLSFWRDGRGGELVHPDDGRRAPRDIEDGARDAGDVGAGAVPPAPRRRFVALVRTRLHEHVRRARRFRASCRTRAT